MCNIAKNYLDAVMFYVCMQILYANIEFGLLDSLSGINAKADKRWTLQWRKVG